MQNRTKLEGFTFLLVFFVAWVISGSDANPDALRSDSRGGLHREQSLFPSQQHSIVPPTDPWQLDAAIVGGEEGTNIALLQVELERLGAELGDSDDRPVIGW